MKIYHHQQPPTTTNSNQLKSFTYVAPVLPKPMYAHIKYVLWDHKKDSTGRMPLMLRVTVDRKIVYIKTGLKLYKKEWDGTEITPEYNGHRKANQALRKKRTDVEDIVFNSELEKKRLSAKEIKDAFEGVVNSTDFFDYAKDLIADIRHAGTDDATNHNKEINRLKKFAGERLDLAQITPLFLRKYEAHERKRIISGRKGVAQNTLNTTFKWFRRIIRSAVAEGMIKSNPFDDYSIPRYVQSVKEYLVEPELEELKNLYKLPLTSALYKTLTYLLFGCYTGLRHSDWVRFDFKTQVEEGFVKLRPKKTVKKTGEWVIIPIGPSLQEIIDRLIELNEEPFSNQKSNINLKALAAMAGIDKRVTTHIGRHTFGYRCACLGLPKSTTAELLGVSEQTVEVYFHLSGANITIQAGVLATV
jgi:site-specific recombinase XerD